MLVIGRRPALDRRPTRYDDGTMRLLRPGHAVWIGADILVRVLNVRRGIVTLGIDAPPTIRIRRDELMDQRP